MSLDRSVSCPAGTLRYDWRSGDTLKGVATAFGTTVSAMIDANPQVDFMTIADGASVCVPSRALTCPNADLYAIRKGDTLFDIARRYGISTEALMELNPYVEPTQLSIGQYICVPRQEEQAPEQTTDESPQKACSARAIVQCGQTLYDILQKYGMTFAEFAALNPALAEKALLPGQSYFYALRACACGESGRYTLTETDTVSSVAASIGISASELMRRNPHLKPDEFTAGTEICLTYSQN